MTKEYFYVNKSSPDGFNNRCKECYIKLMLKNYYKKTNSLSKIFDVQGKSKVPYQKEAKIPQVKMKKWDKDQFLICVLQCRWCSKIHEIRNATGTYNCDCKHNLLYGRSINYLWSKVLYINKLIKGDYIAAFDPWK